MRIQRQRFDHRKRKLAAFTLAEIAITFAIAGLLLSGIIMGFLQSTQRAEWSAYNLAAQNLAMQGVEQARAAKWDPNAIGSPDDCYVTNDVKHPTNSHFLPARLLMDIPVSSANTNFATNYWTIITLGTNTVINGKTNPYPLKFIRVDCAWGFPQPGGKLKIYTNTVATLRAPNQ